MLTGHVSRVGGEKKAMNRGCGAIAYRFRRPLKWDPLKEEFLGDDEANRMHARPMRAPWRV